MSGCCQYEFGPHIIASPAGTTSTWDGKTEPLLKELQQEQITIKDRKTGTTVTGPLMEVLADATKLECFDAKSPKVLTYPTYLVHDDSLRHGFPEKVPDLQKHLDDPANSMNQKEKSKKKKEINDWKKVTMGKLSESRVFDEVVAAAKEQGEECLVMGSYNSDKYMGVVKEKGKNVRNKDVLKPLNWHEQRVVAALKFKIDPTIDVKGFLGNKTNISPQNIEKEQHFASITYKKKLLEAVRGIKKAQLDLSDLTNLLQYAQYSQQLQDSSKEVDILCCFPRRKKIIQIDTKSNTEDKNILTPLQSATKQTKLLNQLFNQWHGEILQGYQFYRIAALPNVDTATKCVPKVGSMSRPPCAKCQDFILTWDKIETIKTWMKNNIFTGTPSADHYPAEYKILVTRIVGFISLAPLNSIYSEIEAANMMSKAITGETSAVSGSSSDAGATDVLTELEKNCGFLGFQEKGQALGSLQVFITWNQQQLSAMLRINNMSWARFMVLVSDFGTGKTILLKNLARAEAERILFGNARPARVFYISLGSAEYTNYVASWEDDSVFDIYTRIEFQKLKSSTGIDVEFRSTRDILDEMIPAGQRNRKLTINQLLVKFLLKYPQDHHYGDEVPTTQDNIGINLMFPTLVDGQVDVWRTATGNIRLALRPAEVAKISNNYSVKLGKYRATLSNQYNVQFPELDHRMRNSAKVAQFSDVVNTTRTPGITGSLPPYINTVTGVTPKYIITKKEDEIYSKGVDYAINNFIGNQPVVILTYDSDDVEKTRNSLISSGSPQRLTVYNPGNRGHYTDTQDKVRNYLQAPDGALITRIDLYNGT